jgi:hypothetical protein
MGMIKNIISRIKKVNPDELYPTNFVIENYRNFGINALNKKVIDEILTKKVFFPNKNIGSSCKAVVNLTSFPERINEVHYVLFSLLIQSVLPERIVLWLSREEFPLGMNELPKNLIEMTAYGVDIKWTRNLGAYTKLVPALQESMNVVHVTADDDIFYHRDWLKDLYSEYLLFGDGFIYAHRAHRIKLNQYGPENYCNWHQEISKNCPSFLNFATGVGGVLYPPNCLMPETENSEIFLKVSPFNDDLWFWAMAVLNDKRIIVTRKQNKLSYINPERELRLGGGVTLAQENVVGSGNDRQLKNILALYPEILTLLFDEERIFIESNK